MKLKVFELFAGIGSQTKALSNLNIDHEVVGISEWDIHAILSYGAVHHNKEIENELERERERERERELANRESLIQQLNAFILSCDSKKPINSWGSHSTDKLQRILTTIKVTNNVGTIVDVDISKIPNHDLLTYSFPCQDLSLQGKRKGLYDGHASPLLWEVHKILKGLKKEKRLPDYLLMENVPSIFSDKNSQGWNEWKHKLKLMGYKNQEIILNGKYFGVPQNRNRAFMISTRNNKVIPSCEQLKNYNLKITKRIKDIEIKDSSQYEYVKLKGKDITLDQLKEQDPKVNLFGMKSTSLVEYTSFASENRVFFKDGIAGTLTATGAQSRLKFPDFKANKPRLILPLEAWRLMGFDDSDFELAKSIGYVSNKYLIKQAGNSIIVPVLEHIFKNMFLGGDK